MPGKEHRYEIHLQWTGNTGNGTKDYRSYERDHVIRAGGKDPIAGSSDPAFRGSAERWNPEDLLVASLSACHKLWYLHLCSSNGVVVTSYEDRAEGLMVEDASKGGCFKKVLLHPHITIAPGSDVEKARALHGEAHGLCFIANSVNFEVAHEPVIEIGE
ncbi:MAG: OsmC family protein [Kiloniellales bacterium]|nr:OsmC family protein [Kiloniellales bacterium]